jgi:hypothetical protein
MLLQDVRIIDKRYSQFDAKKSDPDKGQYCWIKKEYIDGRRFDKNKEWKLWWAPYDVENNLKKYWAWKAKLQFEPVNVKKDPFVADGAIVNDTDWWVFGDLVLVKMPLLDYLMKKDAERRISKKGGKSELMSFYEQTKAQGAALPDNIIDDLMGKEVDPEEVKRRTIKKLL